MQEKRLFFAFSVEAPWWMDEPEGRAIVNRHLTLVFLGNVAEPKTDKIPLPPFAFAPVGIANKILFLPEDKKRVVALHVDWEEKEQEVLSFFDTLKKWCQDQGYSVDERPLLSHVSLARAPFSEEAWNQYPLPLPAVVTGFHLLESKGNLVYESIWNCPLPAPFEEFEHTADIGYFLYGKTWAEVFTHGITALAMRHPPILTFKPEGTPSSEMEVVQMLGKAVSACDAAVGCPFKAVSYHGKKEEKEGIIKWEMVVDV